MISPSSASLTKQAADLRYITLCSSLNLFSNFSDYFPHRNRFHVSCKLLLAEFLYRLSLLCTVLKTGVSFRLCSIEWGQFALRGESMISGPHGIFSQPWTPDASPSRQEPTGTKLVFTNRSAEISPLTLLVNYRCSDMSRRGVHTTNDQHPARDKKNLITRDICKLRGILHDFCHLNLVILYWIFYYTKILSYNWIVDKLLQIT